MAEFKKGAFTVAAKEKVPVVPITLDGTGRLMRNGAFCRCLHGALLTRACHTGKEGLLFPGKVIITVHPPIAPGDADAMCAEAQAVVESALEPKFRVA